MIRVFCILALALACATAARAAEHPTNATLPRPAPGLNAPRAPANRPWRAPDFQKLDLNRATAEQLEELPGIGPATAQAIIKARPFKSIDGLTNVSGIGKAKLANLRPHVTVTPGLPDPVGRPTRGDRPSGRLRPDTPPAANSQQKVNLNTANQEELESLPGIGPTRARGIMNARPFYRIEDIMKVKGIKEAVFREIKDRVTVK